MTIIANPLSFPVSPPRASVKALKKQKTSVPFDVFSEFAASSESFRLRLFVSPSGDPRGSSFFRRLAFASLSNDFRESSFFRRFREFVDFRLLKILQKKFLRHTESLTGSKFELDFGKSKFENQIVDAHFDRSSSTSKTVRTVSQAWLYEDFSKGGSKGRFSLLVSFILLLSRWVSRVLKNADVSLLVTFVILKTRLSLPSSRLYQKSLSSLRRSRECE